MKPLAVIVWLLVVLPCGAYQEPIVTLREYTDTKVDSLAESVDIRFNAVREAIRIASDAQDSRFEAVNEFRGTLTDQATRFVTRDEIKLMIEDIRVLRESKAAMEGKASQTSMLIAIGLGAVGSLVGILNLVYRKIA